MKELNAEQMQQIDGGGWLDWVSCGLSIVGVVGSAMAVNSPAAVAAIWFLRASVISAEISCGAAIFG
ncbi:MAG: hypothetical protein AB1432_10590 [Bacteroidota bacterium]